MDKKALFKLSYGLYLISSKKGEGKEIKFNGQIANAVLQVSNDPIQILIALNKNNLTTEYILESEVFSVSTLSTDTPMKFIGRFGFKSGKEINKFENIEYKIIKDSIPVITENSVAYIGCEVVKSIDVGTHYLLIGKMIDGEILQQGKEVMTYAYYHKVKNGLTPPNAPNFINDKNIEDKDNKAKEDKMKKYRCTVCGYIYDPEKGDPDSGIAPGTPFEDIPDDWVCPVCGVSKSEFEIVED